MSTDESVTKELLETLEDGNDGFSKGAEKLSELGAADHAATFEGFARQRTCSWTSSRAWRVRMATTLTGRDRSPPRCIVAG